jgi:hypothetical protein
LLSFGYCFQFLSVPKRWHYVNIHTVLFLVFYIMAQSDQMIRNGHLRQICVTHSILARIWRGKLHFSQKWPLANVGESGESEQNSLCNMARLMSASLASPCSTAWRMLASLASPTHFQKRPFWRVLKFAKNGEILASTWIH